MSYFRQIISGTFVFSIIFLSSCNLPQQKRINVHNILFPSQWVGNIDRSNFNEPSGICFHSQRCTLFVVGDEGDICEMETTGKLLKMKRIRHADFEGITHDPSSGLLYIVVEGEESIIELDPETFEVLREFSIPRALKGKVLLKAGGRGLEAITFIPDPDHSEGGTFFVANQCFNLDNKEDISAIFEVEVPLKSSRAKKSRAKLIRYFVPGAIDLSGLYYDKTTELLYCISDATNTILEMDKSGILVSTQAFPGDNQEGITVDDDGYMYIAQDSGGIIKMKWNRAK